MGDKMNCKKMTNKILKNIYMKNKMTIKKHEKNLYTAENKKI